MDQANEAMSGANADKLSVSEIVQIEYLHNNILYKNIIFKKTKILFLWLFF